MFKYNKVMALAILSLNQAVLTAYMPPQPDTHWDGYGANPFNSSPTQTNQRNSANSSSNTRQQTFDQNFNNNEFQSSSPNDQIPVKQQPYSPSATLRDSRNYQNSQTNPMATAEPKTESFTYRLHNGSYRLIADNSTTQASIQGLQTVVQLLGDDPNFSTLVHEIMLADLLQTLSGTGPFTIFAPNNTAFQKLSVMTRADLQRPENKQKLVSLLKNHIVPGKILMADLKEGPLKTLNGTDLTVKITNSKVTINGANVIQTDLVGKNGVIQTIDTVLMPTP